MPQAIHLIVEKGPDQGLEIVIPAEGARVGRSGNNDIVLKDPAMSRFHCRLFFKPGEGLWAEDLGSANQTLLNDNPLFEERVRVDDRLTMGDTTLKVVSEEMAAPDNKAIPDKKEQPLDKTLPVEDKAALSTTRPIENLFETPENSKPSANIQFLRPPADKPNRQRRIRILMVVLVVAGMAATAALLVSRFVQRPAPPSALSVKPQLDKLEIAYEKVQANSNNIFRYQMTLKNNRLSIQIDDLKNRRHVPGNQLKKLDPDLVQSIVNTLRHSGLYELKEEYKGLATDVWDVWDLTVTMGKKTKRTRVMNCVEPAAFKTTREAIELFGQNELGLAALALSPEKLLKLARQAHLLGQSLYDQRNIKNENLAMAIRSLKEAEWYLETIEPKPDFYADAVALRGNSERELQEIYNNHLFLAERAIKLGDWVEAAVQYRQICDKIPDRADERHAGVRKKLIDVERRLKRK